ncbi:protoporphyrinogen oxidase, partial [Biomphalaria glabrata]
AEELGLTKHVLPIFPSDPAAKNRYLFVDGKLCALPTNAWSMFKKLPPFTKPLITSLWKEPFHRRSNEQDESIYSYVRRRLGPE